MMYLDLTAWLRHDNETFSALLAIQESIDHRWIPHIKG